MRLPGTWQGNQLEQLESPSSSHWQNFSIANNCYLNLHHWCFNVKCPETRRDFANLPSSTGVEYGSERSVTFVLATADPSIMQANTLNETWGQYILWLCLGSDISVLGAKCFTEAKALIYPFIHLHIFISKHSFFVSCDTHSKPEQLLWLIYHVYVCRSHCVLRSAFTAFRMCSCKWKCRRGQHWGVCI